MDTGKIRAAFSKGIVSVSDNMVSITYVYTDRAFSQSIPEEYMDTLLDLFDNSDCIKIVIEPMKYIQIIFEGWFDITQNMLFNPIKPEITNQELQDLFNKLELKDTLGFNKAFEGVDLSKPLEISRAFCNWEMEKDLREPVPVTSVEILEKLVNRADDLPESDLYEVSHMLIGDEVAGCVDFNVLINQLELKDKEKDIISDLVYLSSVVTIEGDVRDGACQLEFYS